MKEKNKSQLIIYQTESGETKIDVRFQNETVWLSQQLMSELFQTTVPNINMHIKNIFEEGELVRNATIKDFLIVRKEGTRDVQSKVEYYNLYIIISVGYRIKSMVATHFRQWATRHLREFIVKGFVLDDERLKNPNQPFDYDPTYEVSIEFFKTVQNKMHWAITGKTAAEIIHSRVDNKKLWTYPDLVDSI